jgi:hypothetical protein
MLVGEKRQGVGERHADTQIALDASVVSLLLAVYPCGDEWEGGTCQINYIAHLSAVDCRVLLLLSTFSYSNPVEEKPMGRSEGKWEVRRGQYIYK